MSKKLTRMSKEVRCTQLVVDTWSVTRSTKTGLPEHILNIEVSLCLVLELSPKDCPHLNSR